MTLKLICQLEKNKHVCVLKKKITEDTEEAFEDELTAKVVKTGGVENVGNVCQG